jgi:hypothetical protein
MKSSSSCPQNTHKEINNGKVEQVLHSTWSCQSTNFNQVASTSPSLDTKQIRDKLNSNIRSHKHWRPLSESEILWYLLQIVRHVIIQMIKVKSLCFSFDRAPRHEGVLGEWMYSSTHPLTLALDGGEWSASRTGRFTSRERVPGYEAGWDLEPFWTQWWREKFPAPTGNWILVLRLSNP